VSNGRALLEAHVSAATAEAMVEVAKGSSDPVSFEVYKRDERTAWIDGNVPLGSLEALLRVWGAAPAKRKRKYPSDGLSRAGLRGDLLCSRARAGCGGTTTVPRLCRKPACPHEARQAGGGALAARTDSSPVIVPRARQPRALPWWEPPPAVQNSTAT
jgi:hypothetical protein